MAVWLQVIGGNAGEQISDFTLPRETLSPTLKVYRNLRLNQARLCG